MKSSEGKAESVEGAFKLIFSFLGRWNFNWEQPTLYNSLNRPLAHFGLCFVIFRAPFDAGSGDLYYKGKTTNLSRTS